MLRLAVTIESNLLLCLNLLHLQVCMSRLLKTQLIWPHIFRQPILFNSKFRYRLKCIVRQSPPTGMCQAHSSMAPISIVKQRMIIFLPWQTIHATRVVDMAQPVPSYFRRVQLAVSAWRTVASRSNNCWTHILLSTLLSLSLFCHMYQTWRHRLSSLLAIHTTSILKSWAPLIWRWRQQLTRLPYLRPSQITTPTALTIITCDSIWWSSSSFLAHSYDLVCPLSPRNSELTIELLVSDLQFTTMLIFIFILFKFVSWVLVILRPTRTRRFLLAVCYLFIYFWRAKRWEIFLFFYSSHVCALPYLELHLTFIMPVCQEVFSRS